MFSVPTASSPFHLSFEPDAPPSSLSSGSNPPAPRPPPRTDYPAPVDNGIKAPNTLLTAMTPNHTSPPHSAFPPGPPLTLFRVSTITDADAPFIYLVSETTECTFQFLRFVAAPHSSQKTTTVTTNPNKPQKKPKTPPKARNPPFIDIYWAHTKCQQFPFFYPMRYTPTFFKRSSLPASPPPSVASGCGLRPWVHFARLAAPLPVLHYTK